MPTGLKIPVRVSESGGAAIERDETEQNKKLLFLALQDGNDNNPFQELGIAKDSLFSVIDGASRGVASRAIRNVMKKFEDRIAFAPDKPIKFKVNGDGEIEVSFEYVDLFTNTVEEFRTTFKDKNTKG